MTRKILVCPYQPVWVQQFESEAGVLWGIFGSEATAIHHIGSTSIPGMSAKPTIDLLVEVRDISGVDRFNEKLGESGYTPKGENGIPGRRYFFKESQDLHVCHVHCFQSGDGQIERHLNFRDYLMAHPREARSYSQLKEILADQFSEDIDSYCEGKDRFIQEIDRKARVWRESLRRWRVPKLEISIKNHTGKPISAGQVRLFPSSQALVIQVSGRRDLVWNRPAAVGVQMPGEEVRFIPIYDYTRLAQVLILAASLFGSFLIWLFLHRR